MVSVASAISSSISSIPRPVVRPGTRKLMGWIVLSGLATVAAVFAMQRVVTTLVSHSYADGNAPGFDFLAYYNAAWALRTGHNIYSITDPQYVAALFHQPNAGTSYLYPPLLAALLVPSTMLPYSAALIGWFVILFAAWIATAFLLRSILQHITGETWTLFVFGVVLSCGPVMAGFQLGQASVLVLFGFCLVLWLDLKGHAQWLGFTLALLGWIKLYPLILLPYYAARGRKDVVKSSVLWLILLGIPQFLLIGWSGFRNMVVTILGFSTKSNDWQNQSLRVAPTRLLALMGVTTPNFIGGVIALAIAAVTVYGVWRCRTFGDTWSHVLGFCWSICALVLVIPVTWDHYYAWLIPACVFGIAYCFTHAVSRWTLVLMSIGFLATVFIPVTYLSMTALTFYTSVRPLGALCLWLAVGWVYLRPSEVVVSRSQFSALYAAGSVLTRLLILSPAIIVAAIGKVA